jgi:hypothetical protein
MRKAKKGEVIVLPIDVYVSNTWETTPWVIYKVDK